MKLKTITFFLLAVFSLAAQSDTYKDTTKIKHYTPSSPDLPEQYKEYLELSKKNPHKTIWYPEDFGVQYTDAPKEELLQRLTSSKDNIELRKIAQVLGDRAMTAKFNLTDEETQIVNNKVRSYIRSKADFDGDNSEVHDQIIRFWDLAVPEMLRHLEHENPYVRSFVFNALVQMRSEKIN